MSIPAITDLRTEQIRSSLEAIAAANNNLLNPVHVVEAARDPNHVLHDEFTWDDTEAARAYRLVQAGALIRRVKLTLIRPDTQTKALTVTTTRAFQSRPSVRGTNGGYESVETIMSDADKRDELLTQVLRELAAYRKRYSNLAALSDVWSAIDDAVQAINVSVVASTTEITLQSRPQ